MKGEKNMIIPNAGWVAVNGLLTEKHIGQKAYMEFLVKMHETPLQCIDGRLGSVTGTHLVQHG
jgi:hypothetical protein